MSRMRRIFVDANVLVAGADSTSGASNAILKLAEVGLFQLVVSRQVLDETERNLRKKLPRALPNFIAQMARLRLEIVPDPTPDEVAPWITMIHPSDAPILCAAVKISADRCLTLDTRHFTPAVAAQSGLLIQSPAQLIAELRDLVTKGIATR
jgi:predicted nucleic acid-binding protein